MPFRTLAFLFVALTFGGCATYPDMKAFVKSHRETPVSILLIEAPPDIDHSRLQAVFAPSAKSPSGKAIASGIEHAQSRALDLMKAMLERHRSFEVVSEPQPAKVARMLKKDPDHPLSQEDADAIHAETGADAIFLFRITDYGLTPGSWRDGYIAFEVSSTLAIAGVIAYTGSAAAHAAAGGYLVQETVEETTEAYAGFWGLDVVTRPVRLEAELVRLKPVGRIWKTDETGLSDIRLSRLTRTIPASERDLQLDQSTNHAINDISADLKKWE